MQVTTLVFTSTQSITIDKTDGVQSVSVLSDPSGGNFTIVGNIPFKGFQPQPVTLPDSTGVVLQSENPASPLDGVTISWVSGIVSLIISWQ